MCPLPAYKRSSVSFKSACLVKKHPFPDLISVNNISTANNAYTLITLHECRYIVTNQYFTHIQLNYKFLNILCDKVCQWFSPGTQRFPPPIKLTATI
jgi:hypothetical protein